ncbi:MAG: DUF1015 domain-containing protein [Oscillospiraceae bacterium]|jgi:uncharacterized protein (DUF1015 family)|nr:DUF1015 domain-containing protein [Oscillospiraceae bacterium]
MATIKPFGAMRFTGKAGDMAQLVCPPYDIISDEERRAYLAANSYNIIRLELPREGAEPYAAAGATLRGWLDEGLLACDAKDAVYIYEEEFDVFGQTKRLKGLVCRVGLEPFENGVVLPHEETLSKAKTDRFNLMCATGCNFSSIYSLYFDEDATIASRVEALSAGKPDVSFTTAADGIRHSVWIVTDPAEVEALKKAFGDKKLYIADGHHRYETALNYQKHLRETGVNTQPDHPANDVMMTLVSVSHPGLVVFPTHRVVRGLDGFDAGRLLDACARYFDVESCGKEEAQEKLDAAAGAGRKAFALYAGGAMSLLTLRDQSVMEGMLPSYSDAYRALDVSVLHTLVLERLLGIDKENMANQKNLTYTRDAGEAITAVDAGDADCAFLINPTRVDEIAAVAGAGEKMPQKSTYFYPKLITGHIMNKIL